MTLSESKTDENKTSGMTTLSVCDVMRDNTNEVIMRIESLLPNYVESFVNLQAEYLRIARDFFGTCYIVEKELLSNIGIDERAIREFDKYLKVLSKSTISEIDMTNKMQTTFVNNTIISMKIYDEYFKIMLSWYAKMLEYMNASIPQRK
jgi:hypothetical protein